MRYPRDFVNILDHEYCRTDNRQYRSSVQKVLREFELCILNGIDSFRKRNESCVFSYCGHC